jgi:hypothetical protein
MITATNLSKNLISSIFTYFSSNELIEIRKSCTKFRSIINSNLVEFYYYTLIVKYGKISRTDVLLKEKEIADLIPENIREAVLERFYYFILDPKELYTTPVHYPFFSSESVYVLYALKYPGNYKTKGIKIKCSLQDISKGFLDQLNLCQGISKISLSYSKDTAEQINHFLDKSLYITDIDIDGNCNRDFFNIISANKKIKKLRFNSKLGEDETYPDFCNFIKFTSILKILNIASNRINEINIINLSNSLSTNSTLTYLNLNDNTIGPEGSKILCEALNSNETITSLSLWKNQILDEGALHFSNVLKGKHCLKRLDLSKNNIQDIGSQQLYDVLPLNPQLTHLDLINNKISVTLLIQFSEFMANNSISIFTSNQLKY